MPMRRKSGGAVRDRVLEGRHVIGLFVIILLFSGLFFALGFVMGRSQYDGKVIASSGPATGLTNPFETPKPSPNKRDYVSTANRQPVSSPAPVPTTTQNPVWDTGDFDGAKRQDHLDPSTPAARPAQKNPQLAVKANPKVVSTRDKVPVPAQAPPPNLYVLQVAALKSQADAFALAKTLQAKKFPASVVPPQNDQFYRVQVGPYDDQKSADAAKKGLEGAGFKAIVKH
jgi:cell division septation protein DedD